MSKWKERIAAREAEKVRQGHLDALKQAMVDDARTKPEREREALRAEYQRRAQENPVAASVWLNSVPLRASIIFDSTETP
jgi:hypothetical protein